MWAISSCLGRWGAPISISPQTRTSPAPCLEASVPSAKHRREEAFLLRSVTIWEFSLGNVESYGWILFSRRVISVKAAPPSRAVGKAATRPVLQKAAPTGASGGGKRRGGEESLVQKENKKSEIDAADKGAGSRGADRELVSLGTPCKTEPPSALEQRPPGSKLWRIPWVGNGFGSSPLKHLNLFQQAFLTKFHLD